MIQTDLHLDVPGRGLHDITPDVVRAVADAFAEAPCAVGLCHLFICHTSASLLLTENADPDVHRDLETFLADLVPDGDPRFLHDSEGPDDMPAHIRSVLTQTHLTLPLREGRLLLGTWQGVYVFEHRLRPQRRRVVGTVQGV